VIVEGAPETVIGRLDGRNDVSIGTRVGLTIDANDIHRFSADGLRVSA
jgi:hypothetical protein